MIGPYAGSLSPPFAALFPASVGAGLIGTVIFVFATVLLEAPGNGIAMGSISDLFNALLLVGVGIAFGAFAGAFLVLWHLVIFGLPVALIIGRRIERPAGIAACMASCAIALVIAYHWVAGIFRDGAIVAPDPTTMAAIAFYALPAAWLYRRWIMALRAELEVD
ncbi:MAG: hypothetical protein QNI87_12260 [Erythrobacter sp.]|uniref:hypothetical protein n=1 Tax=Erythrobacter sp. TaxID=1042 RepID=UPI00262E81A5|nr:hypothetical protein [Erythrobacter sp.]MDJ0979290.1 hypothetical protein [Erythrobacter sp.]